VNLRTSRQWVVAILSVGATVLALTVPAAQAGTANAGLPGAGSNPIAHMTWGTPHNDDLWNAFEAARGSQQMLLGELAGVPRAVWLGYWNPTKQMTLLTAESVAESQNGNPNALTSFVTFELNPWEKGAAHASWNVSADETWYRDMAAGIGNARAMVILQADLPYAHTTTSTAPAQIDTYAARLMNALPRTTVYIDAGTEGWYNAMQDAQLLVANGIRYARGFSLNDTDYDTTAVDDEFGGRVIADLAKLGVTGKHFIVDRPGTRINLAPICHGNYQTICQRTGIPPTTNVASPQWELGAAAAKVAKQYCDGYVWSGRPWNIDAGPFVPQYAMWLAANSEY
jgi:endoglucanase